MQAIQPCYPGGITPQAGTPIAEELAATKVALEQALADRQRLEGEVAECRTVIEAQRKVIAELRTAASTPTEKSDAEVPFDPHQKLSVDQMREMLRQASKT